MTIFSDNLTAQQIFDHVVVQLALQGRVSRENTVCALRGDGGAKCAVGFLLTDDEAISNRTCGVTVLAAVGKLPRRLTPHVELLKELQHVHDTCVVDRLFARHVFSGLTGVANKFNLEKGVLYAAFPQPGAVEQKPAPLAKPKSFGAVMTALEQIMADYLYTQSNTPIHVEGKG